MYKFMQDKHQMQHHIHNCLFRAITLFFFWISSPFKLFEHSARSRQKICPVFLLKLPHIPLLNPHGHLLWVVPQHLGLLLLHLLLHRLHHAKQTCVRSSAEERWTLNTVFVRWRNIKIWILNSDLEFWSTHIQDNDIRFEQSSRDQITET